MQKNLREQQIKTNICVQMTLHMLIISQFGKNINDFRIEKKLFVIPEKKLTF